MFIMLTALVKSVDHNYGEIIVGIVWLKPKFVLIYYINLHFESFT